MQQRRWNVTAVSTVPQAVSIRDVLSSPAFDGVGFLCGIATKRIERILANDDTEADVSTVVDLAKPSQLSVAYIQSPYFTCLLYTSPSPRDQRGSRMPSSA